jgi:hypothetical protein
MASNIEDTPHSDIEYMAEVSFSISRNIFNKIQQSDFVMIEGFHRVENHIFINEA